MRWGLWENSDWLPPAAPPTKHSQHASTACSLCYRLLKYRMSDLAGAGRDTDFTVYDQVGGHACGRSW